MDERPSQRENFDDVRGSGVQKALSVDSKHSRISLLRSSFYKQQGWFEKLLEVVFELKERDVTVKSEVYAGFIQFVSCLYCLAVVPQQLENAGYDSHASFAVTCYGCAFGSLLVGAFANLPFVSAPPTAVSIFLSVFLRSHNLPPQVGNMAVVISGFVLIGLAYRPLGQCLAFMIPGCIQIGVAVGIGMFTALAGSADINLVVDGAYTVVTMGTLTDEIAVCFTGVVIVAVCMHYHVKASFCMSLLFTSLFWWTLKNEFPDSVVRLPTLKYVEWESGERDGRLLTFDLIFIYVLFLNGLVYSLGDLAKILQEDFTVPKGQWVYLVSGVMTIFSGLYSGAPILISPESAAGIKAGARTGLSTMVCGCCFLCAVFFGPVFQAVPTAGTSALLIMIGVILFQNTNKMDWHVMKEAVPCFLTLFYICTTYSILLGTAIGYTVYLAIHLLTGDIEVIIRTMIRDTQHIYGNAKTKVTKDGESDAPITSVLATFINDVLEYMNEQDTESPVINMGYPEMLGEDAIQRRSTMVSRPNTMSNRPTAPLVMVI